MAPSWCAKIVGPHESVCFCSISGASCGNGSKIRDPLQPQFLLICRKSDCPVFRHPISTHLENGPTYPFTPTYSANRLIPILQPFWSSVSKIHASAQRAVGPAIWIEKWGNRMGRRSARKGRCRPMPGLTPRRWPSHWVPKIPNKTGVTCMALSMVLNGSDGIYVGPECVAKASRFPSGVRGLRPPYRFHDSKCPQQLWPFLCGVLQNWSLLGISNVV